MPILETKLHKVMVQLCILNKFHEGGGAYSLLIHIAAVSENLMEGWILSAQRRLS